MGGSSRAPKPTAEETALQQEQLSALRQERAETEAFKPLLYKQMGLREVARDLSPEQLARKSVIEGELSKWRAAPQSDSWLGKPVSSRIQALETELAGIPRTSLEEIPWEERLASMSPQERAGYELNALYLQRQRDAMEGKLPVSPAMEAELTQQRSDIEANLSRRLGSNWQQSTPGIQAMGEFNKRAGLLREETRRGQISSGEGLLGARMGLLQGQQGQFYNQAKGFPVNNMTQQYGQAMAPYQDYRNMQYQASAQDAANRTGLIAGAGATAATIAVII